MQTIAELRHELEVRELLDAANLDHEIWVNFRAIQQYREHMPTLSPMWDDIEERWLAIVSDPRVLEAQWKGRAVRSPARLLWARLRYAWRAIQTRPTNEG